MSGSGILDGIEGSPAAAPLADWNIDYREFSQIYQAPEESFGDGEPIEACAAPTLEAEIAAFVSAAATGLRQTQAETPRRPSPELRVLPSGHGQDFSDISPKNVPIMVNELEPQPPSWLDIRPVAAAQPASVGRPVHAGGVRQTSTMRAVLAVGLGLAIGWISILPLSFVKSYLMGEVQPLARPLMDVPRQEAAVGRPTAGANAAPRRDGSGKAATAVPGHGRRLAQTTQPKPIKVALITPQVAVAADAASPDFVHKGDLGPRPLPFPETKPATVPGWSVRDVTGGTAILDGPERSWKAVRGDMVPGVGRLESIVRWGDRWIVATEAGLISTP